ncbi:MAG TPA: amino acid adenylation domain-containing protein, partial [Pyrinomonadaceae bacterium]
MSTEISNLSLVEKRALLAQLLKQKADQPEAPSPLSYGQRAWWFLYQLEPQNPAYNIMMPVRILSKVDAAVLRRCFEQLVARHASLRTSYTIDGSKLVQKVQDGAEIDYDTVDASAWDEERLREVVSEEMHRPFDLERGSVLRIRLYTLSEREHVFTMVVHHIAFDLWSLVLFMHELGVVYAAEQDGRPTPLAPLKYRYTDYVRQQLKLLSGAQGEQHWNYWREQLSGELSVLNLPTYAPRPTVQTFRGATSRFTLSTELSDRLKALSQANGATLYMTMLAAYQVLLHRYSGQNDIIVGSLAAAGRNLAEFSGLVGFFDNQIALRADLSRDPTFEQFLAQVRQTVLDALKHQNYPFPLLVEKLQPERDTSRSPIFQTMFILQRAQLPEEAGLIRLGLGMTNARMQLGELILEPMNFDRRVAGGLAGQLDLTLVAADLEDRLECSLQYNPDIFDTDTAEQMARQFQSLLESIVAEPGRSVGTLSLLSDKERQRSIVEWNDTAVEREFECLHRMFERQAERDPDATAAVFRGQRLPYGELNRRANRLAHYLRSLGVGAEVRVGICFERSTEMLVAVLGILKAGGAYVPLDPNYPQDRLAFMLEDARVRVLLTQQHLAERFASCGARILRLDADWPEIERRDDTNPVLVTTTGHLAYIIYTSGSTGRPKGVMIDHRGAANTIIDMNERYAVSRDDRVLALSSLSFDLSVYDMLGTLAAGAAIVVPNPSATPDPADWLDLIKREEVTVWNSAPALMEVFAEYVSGHSALMPRSLRIVLMSGDWIPVKLPDQIRSLAANNGIEVHSLGGATEASIWSIAFPIKSVDTTWKSIPYGLPMINQQFHVLDAFLAPTPVGVVGELYIGGIGVARGYHDRQELTAEKFIPDPYAPRPGMRLYRTGDLGRRLPDGNIEFLGRIDGQVKIHGFRIELGEIETALGNHPSVRETVVKTQVVASGEKQLVAYVVPKQETDDPADPRVAAAATAGMQVWASLVELGREQAKHPTIELDASAFPVLTECLNRLTVAYLCNTFRKLGVFTRPGEELSLEEFMERSGCVARYHKAVKRWLKLLAAQGLLRRRGAAYVSDEPLAIEAFDALWERVYEQLPDTETRASFNYIKSCGENLADVLTGKLHPAQLLFKEGEPTVAESFYDEGFRYCNAVAREATRGIVRAWPRGQTLRVLEVGAGIGSTTAWLLPELNAQTTAYAYTDISKYFMEMSRKQFGDYPFISYGMLDIEQNPRAQGYEPHSFDFIIASSVLHATRDVKATLRHVRSLLAPRGLLLLVEETVFHNWFNVVGIQEGFDRFEDEALRQEHPFLTSAQWERELRAHGFEAVESFTRDRFTAEFLGLDVIVAQASPAMSAHIEREELRSYLRGNLPEFMIPSAYVVLDALPLTPNGKVDHRALPALDRAALDEMERAFVAPRNPTEEVLAGLWAQVLRREHVGVEDNFFESGGDSLLATQLISRLRNVFNVELPLYCLFEAPTVAGLAAKIDASYGEGRASASPPLRRIPRGGHLPLSYAQQRLWFLDRLVPGNPFYNVTTAVRFTGALDRAVLERSLNEIVRRHESLRTTFLEVDGQAAQVVGEAWPVNIRLVDFAGRAPETQEEELQSLATEETQRPFNLIMGPLLRVVLARLGEREHVLLLTLHHIIFDGWSFSVLLREIAALYEAEVTGKPSPLTELPVQYADFAHWQREWLQGGVLEEQLGYWRKQLAGSTVLQLPTDRPRPETQTFRGGRHLSSISAELSASLKELSSRHDVT